MAEPSPPQPSRKSGDENEGKEGRLRKISTGGLVRVYKSRQKQRERSRLVVTRPEGEDEESEAESDDAEEGRVTPITQNMSNHYTLNLPGPAAPQSDTPYVLLG
jgi:hypothetical protein